MLRNLIVGGLAGVLGSQSVAADRTIVIPTKFAADRVYVKLTTARGLPLLLWTDSGGGALFFTPAAAARLGLITSPIDPEARAELGPDAASTVPPALASGLPPLPTPAAVTSHISPWGEPGDGLLGAPWFAGGVWTWDYPGHRLIRESDKTRIKPGPHVIPLGFKVRADGKRPFSFARISVKIDGQTLPMLLDTGATTKLTPSALAKVGDKGPALRATSMIAANVFDRWHKDHPDWPYLKDGQEVFHSPMIQVPSVEIAGYTVGPVWFTYRPDTNFHDMMSSDMDSQIEGAIGGNVFGHFSMTVDYPSARAAFRCKIGCGRPQVRGGKAAR